MGSDYLVPMEEKELIVTADEPGIVRLTLNRPVQLNAWTLSLEAAFFDALEVQKGPSLGTNFTLACPYTVLAHYMVPWAEGGR